MRSKAKFEIIVTISRKRYKAVSPSFPGCKGSGKTEAEAIEKLSGSISKSIAAMAKDALYRVMTSETLHTETLQATPRSTELKKIFEVDPTLFAKPQSRVSISYPRSKSIYRVPADQDIRRLFGMMETASNAFEYSGGINGVSAPDDHDDDFGVEDIAFGFPLSLN
ncbi:hypothetical protein EBR96_06570 [bacterium]|nr:hypothetical protein [bacterium]